jgi:hypothetical protein
MKRLYSSTRGRAVLFLIMCVRQIIRSLKVFPQLLEDDVECRTDKRNEEANWRQVLKYVPTAMCCHLPGPVSPQIFSLVSVIAIYAPFFRPFITRE